MAGMSPRMKAKKGRFSPAGLPVVVTVISPLAGANNTPISASATAIDPESGDVSSFLVWTSDIDGQVGTGANPILTLTGLVGSPGVATTHVLTVGIPNDTASEVVVNITVS